jgi:pimeloyl-ACP methyl ester carboxylesterase
VELSYDRSGEGDPLVLLHGIGMQWQAWKPLLPELTREREVFAVDLPGFGGSPTLPPGVVPDPPAIADAVAAFLDTLGLDRPAIGGLSLGGWVALELAKRGRARSVVAISPGGFLEGRAETENARWQLWTSVHAARAAPKPLEWLARRPRGRLLTLGGMVGHPSRVPAGDAIGMMRALAASPGFDETLEASGRTGFSGGDQIDVPVTLAWGTRDRLLWPRQGRRALEQIPGAKLVPLPGAGHVPMWDEPETLTRLLLAT